MDKKRSYTHLNEDDCDLNIYQCNDCGAHADKPENIIHYDTCMPGESKHWEDYYKNINWNEEK
jgi:hypothetical protein